MFNSKYGIPSETMMKNFKISKIISIICSIIGLILSLLGLVAGLQSIGNTWIRRYRCDIYTTFSYCTTCNFI